MKDYSVVEITYTSGATFIIEGDEDTATAYAHEHFGELPDMTIVSVEPAEPEAVEAAKAQRQEQKKALN